MVFKVTPVYNENGGVSVSGEYVHTAGRKNTNV